MNLRTCQRSVHYRATSTASSHPCRAQTKEPGREDRRDPECAIGGPREPEQADLSLVLDYLADRDDTYREAESTCHGHGQSRLGADLALALDEFWLEVESDHEYVCPSSDDSRASGDQGRYSSLTHNGQQDANSLVPQAVSGITNQTTDEESQEWQVAVSR